MGFRGRFAKLDLFIYDRLKSQELLQRNSMIMGPPTIEMPIRIQFRENWEKWTKPIRAGTTETKH